MKLVSNTPVSLQQNTFDIIIFVDTAWVLRYVYGITVINCDLANKNKKTKEKTEVKQNERN
jgi:hypothetical protein